MAGLALLAATGGAILDGSSTPTARAVETTIVDLVLPDLATMPDDLPGRARRVEGGGTRIAAPESFPDRPAGSHMQLSAASEDTGATHSPRPAAASPALDKGSSVTGADVETVPGASPGSSALADVATPANTGEPPVVAPAHRVTVNSGDSLYLIFKRLGLQQRDLALMTGLKPLAKKLARIAPRQEIEFYVDTESRLTRLVHRLDRLRSLHVFREGDAFAFEEVVEPPETAVATAAGVIDTSLFEAGQHAGLSDSLIIADGRDFRLGR